MKKILTSLLALIGLVVTSLVAVFVTANTPAFAADRWVYHQNDEGYDAPFKMRCGNLQVFWVPEGTGSSRVACATGHGVAIWVGSGEQIRCVDNFGIWHTVWDADNFWYALSGGETRNCVNQLD
jgi:hypothetical protein